METQLDMPIFLGLPWQIQLAWTLKQTSEEYDEDDFFRAKYVHSQNVDEPVRMERPESPHTNNAYARQEFYFHRDRLGNITEITDFEGTVVQSYVYDAFGKVTIYDKDGNEITPSSSNYLETPYAFTGRELDAETGLYFYRARYYDPNLGRFISEDPIAFLSSDTNFYRYIFNSPVNLTDPSGLLTIALSFGVVGFIGESSTVKKGIARSKDIGVVFHVESLSYKFFEIEGRGVKTDGAFVGGGLTIAAVEGDFNDFFGTGIEVGANVGFGFKSYGANAILTSTGKLGGSFDVGGFGFGLGIAQRRTTTTACEIELR